MYQRRYIVSYGGISEPQLHYGVHTCGTNIAKKQHPMLAMSKGDSHVWKKMVEIIGEEVEHNIWWQIKSSEVSFWFDNWTKQGALFYTDNQGAERKK